MKMYIEIFREIVEIMHYDYSGCIDKKGWDNPKKIEQTILELEKKDKLTSNRFSEIIQDYMLDFKDPHIIFKPIKSDSQKEYDNGFRVRRYEDKLYIRTLTAEKRLEIGEAILSLDQIPIPELVNKHQRELMEEKAEREEWRNIIYKYKVAAVRDTEGNVRLLDLKKYEKSYKPKHTIKKVDEDTLCITLSDFFDPTPIEIILEKHKEVLKNAKNLIIDVRVNYGGTDQSFVNLGKYIFPVGMNKIDNSFYNMKFNCTERNADLMIQWIDEEIVKTANEQYREGLKQWKEQTWEKYRGKGFISFNEDSSDGNEFEIEGQEYPKNIIILTDNYCGSAGDIFVYLCKQSPKVTVVGRPTMGINDYSNLTTINWNNQFELLYPTSRLDQLDSRDQDHEQGINPHIYIPWTPQHLKKDVDMEVAMRLLQETTRK
jgi:C-terminal processing protease CtpA/Prc